jgi:tetratricopeptide (TPR) repeat protein
MFFLDGWKMRTVLAGVLCMALVMSLQGCGSKESQVEGFVERGDHLLAEGDVKRAILEYKNALQIDPKSAEVKFALGKAHLREKEARTAINYFRSAVEDKPDYDAAHMEIASLLSIYGYGQEALDELDKIKDSGSFQPKLATVKAQALMNGKRYPEAIVVLDDVKGKDSNDAVQALLTICFRETKDFEKMEEAAAKWRTINPKDQRPYVFMARHAASRGDEGGVLRELDSMVNANAQNSQYKLLRAKALEDFGMMKDAETAFQNLPQEIEMLRAQAGFWQRREQPDRALQALDKILTVAPSDVDAMLQAAQALVAKNQIQTAIDRVEKSLQLDLVASDRQKLMLAKASLKATQGDVDAAKAICADVLKENQGNIDAHLLLGRLHLQTGKTEDAELHLNQVAVARPNDPGVQILLARTQRIDKKSSLALDTLRSAIRTNPESTELRLELVNFYLGEKNGEQALRTLDQGIELKPRDVTLLNRRGEIYVSRKEMDKAEQDFQEIVKAQPNSAMGYLKMGQLMTLRSKLAEAAEWYGKALKLDEAWHLALPPLVAVLLKKNDAKTALSVAEVEAGKRPDSAVAQFILAQTFNKTGSPDKAEEQLNKAIALAPEWIEPYRMLTDLYVKKGKTQDAQKRLEELVRKNPTPAAAMTLALFHEQLGHYKDADKIFADILKTNKTPGVLNDLAFLYSERSNDPNDLKRASDLAAQALARQPDNPVYLDTSAWVAYKQGKIDEAWNRLQEALVRSPDTAPVNLHAAIIAHAKGQKDLARQHLDKVIGQDSDPVSQQQAVALKKQWGEG